MPSELEGLIFSYFFGENRILGCLGSILEASWVVLAEFFGLSWSPRRPGWAPRRPQEVPRSSPRRTKIHPKLLGDFLKLFRHKKKRFCDPTAHEKQHARAILDRFEKDFRTMLGYFLKLFRHKKDVIRNETGTKQETKWKRTEGIQKEIGASRSMSSQVFNTFLCIFQYFLDHFLNCGGPTGPRGGAPNPQFKKWSKKY